MSGLRVTYTIFALGLLGMLGCSAEPSVDEGLPTAVADLQPSVTPSLAEDKAVAEPVPFSSLVEVVTADVVAQNGRLQVVMLINLPDQCYDIGSSIQSKRGRNVQLSISQVKQDNVLCAAQERQVEHIIEIDTVGLESAFYTLNVNNVATSFALDETLRSQLDAALTVEEIALATAVARATATAAAEATRLVRAELGVGEVHGTIWHDMCVSDLTASATDDQDAPVGCVRSEDGAIVADGDRFSPDTEEGIPFVEVSLVFGDCSTQVASAAVRVMTAVDGRFDFYDVLPGRYCLQVADSEINQAILDIGVWTTSSSRDIMAVPVDIAPSQVVTDISIGWDYAFLPREDVARGCVNKGLLIRDVTYEDVNRIDPGRTVTKSWRVKNIGTCTWTSAYGLAWTNSAGLVDTERIIPLDLTITPNETQNIEANLVVPEQSGRYRWTWFLVDENREPFSVAISGREPLVFEFVVPQPATPTPTSTPEP